MANWIAESESYCKRSKIGNVEEVFESNGNIVERRLWTATREVYNAMRRRSLDHRQMYPVLEQSVSIMRYLTVFRRNCEGFVGASFCRIESNKILWIRASVVQRRPENERLQWVMGGRRVCITMVRSKGREDRTTSAAEWHAESCRKLPAGGPRQA